MADDNNDFDPEQAAHGAAETISAIDELRSLRQWVAWQLQVRINSDGSTRTTKVPINAQSGCRASVSNRADWGTYQQAKDAVRRYGADGVCVVLTRDDDLTGIDLDKCREPQTGQLDPWAAEIVALAESYAEISIRDRHSHLRVR